MILQMYKPNPYVSLVGGANAYGEIGYASLLHRLMHHGANASYADIPPGGTYDFAARCEVIPIKHQDNLASSWREVKGESPTCLRHFLTLYL